MEIKGTKMKETAEEYIARLKDGLVTLESKLYETKMSAQEVNTRKNKQIAEQQAEIADLKLQNEYLKGCQPNIEIIAENERLKKELHMAEEGYALLHKIYFKKV